ncbi:4-hydroxybenzoate polyprenyltransferase [Rhodothalassium salexigens DSM 2132]|uniref:4-hydroxybenzoate octaprenyltransferase n=1 Tax=Rhodothalassium salexigens DSM 2132 TaxID=1188247 RepID=A0A4R2PDY4_RHOSA|nr:4-hydroxybenzoate octaprenyltransferase [Rhodothalassium salexigens]MBB4211963.1 4-hydroxybenzoate polyprenyltransferase [Rhodothalassium salexigens DSM 2132]MBK1638625.1 4-hydroxybenzoate polyprenyltransferase [Rhodothalassium salexigens DSM 2132]TCP33453.1 4-hydroxybenzoate polyprenyltransferase [Rhodothalassium salexigens DSM 2132]
MPPAPYPSDSAPSPLGPDDALTPDALPDSWVARTPRPVRPYLRLMRADRPAGFWLLMWPCLWSTALAVPATEPQFWILCALFLVGSIVMRGAGCAWNDIVDRSIDLKVARTAARPIPAGQVSWARALAFAVGLSLTGLLVLIQLNGFAIALGIVSLIPVAIYPFAKRFTYWPQAVLGLTFNWGALMGWAAVSGGLAPAALVLYAGCLFWTLGYDTIYAHQDKADDLIAGVKSTALKLGPSTRAWVIGFYALFVAGLTAAGALAHMAWPYYLGVAATAAHLAWQTARLDIDDPTRCLDLFRANTGLGWVPFAGAVAAGLLAV